MPIPKVGQVLNGWTKKHTVKTVTKTTVDHRVTESTVSRIVSLFLAPMPAQQVARKPEEQRAWKWFRVLTKSSEQDLNIDDIIVAGSVGYRIESKKDWSEAGYKRYDAVEDYTGGS